MYKKPASLFSNEASPTPFPRRTRASLRAVLLQPKPPERMPESWSCQWQQQQQQRRRPSSQRRLHILHPPLQHLLQPPPGRLVILRRNPPTRIHTPVMLLEFLLPSLRHRLSPSPDSRRVFHIQGLPDLIARLEQAVEIILRVRRGKAETGAR